MKTVFLFLRQGISNRNFLRTDFLRTLKDNPEVRTVVLSPIGDDPAFREEFEAPNVKVDKWPRTKTGFWEKRLKNLKDYIWVSRGLTKAIRVRRLAQRGHWGLAWRDMVGTVARRMGISEEKINQWELSLYKSRPSVAQLFDRYKPNLVVFTRLFATNLHVIKEAKKRGIPVLCLVESWDNFICKGPLSAVPDRMAVWNVGMVNEAYELHGFPRERVEVVGVPQFDLYTDARNILERKEFFEIHGLDPEKKLITYAASTQGFVPDEPDVFDKVYEVLRSQLGVPVQMMLRLHPITTTALRDEYLRRFSRHADLVVQSPGRVSALHDHWDPSWSDMINLASTIYYSDVIVNIASTMAIDAAVMDKPVIAVGFGSKVKNARSKWFLDDIFEHSHYRRLMETKGLRLVRSPVELVEAVGSYLVDPSIDAAGRSRLREELCFRLDGKAGWRAASVVLRELGISAVAGSAQESEMGRERKDMPLAGV